jgi:hypothetical protein
MCVLLGRGGADRLLDVEDLVDLVSKPRAYDMRTAARCGARKHQRKRFCG